MRVKKFLDGLPRNFKSPEDDLQDEFLVPGLKLCKHYRRNTAWFRQSTLGIYAPSIESIIKNNAKLDMLVSLTGNVDKDIIVALEKTRNEESRKKLIQRWGDQNIREITGLNIDPKNKKLQHHVLTYLLAQKIIEIRFAITRTDEEPDDENLFHEKVGYMTFDDDYRRAFLGNFNESAGSIKKHGERLLIFKSTKANDEEDINYFVNDIDKQWENKDPYTEVHKVSEETLDRVKEYSLTEEEIIDLSKRYRKPKKPEPPIPDPTPPEDIESLPLNVPHIPETYKGKPFQPGAHQTRALNAWVNNDYLGILEHATGSGKTITAIYGLCRLTEDSKKIGIISVPYQSLADQWVEELKMFNLSPIKCYEKFTNWGLKAEQEIARFKMKDPEESFLLPIVVVNKTLHSEKFQDLLKLLNMKEVIYVADECHRYAKIEGTAK